MAFEPMPESHIFVMRTVGRFVALAAMSNPLQTCDGAVTTAISQRIQRKKRHLFDFSMMPWPEHTYQGCRSPLSFLQDEEHLLSEEVALAHGLFVLKTFHSSSFKAKHKRGDCSTEKRWGRKQLPEGRRHR